MSHTPGPWKAEFWGDNSCDIHAGDKLIAEMEYPDGDHCDADALLIAAAPDLLDACRSAFQVMEEVYIDEAMAGTISLLKAAIHKATIRHPD